MFWKSQQMRPPSLADEDAEPAGTSRPPPPSFLVNSFSDRNSQDMGFPLTTLGISSHNILSSTTPYNLIESLIPHNEYPLDLQHRLNDINISTQNLSTYLQDPILNGEINHQLSMTLPAMISTETPPKEVGELDDELGVFHLLMAYAEAIEMDQDELAEVMVKRIGEKVSPTGETLERLMYYMFQTVDRQSDYLKQEATKNYCHAFKAFYQIFPNGKFAHFAANSAILESLTDEIEILYIFDFDIGEGVQWASLIAALRGKKRHVVVNALRFDDDDVRPSMWRWRFEDTKKRLCDCASSCGLMLKVEEVDLNNLVGNHLEEELVLSVAGRRRFFVFNSMSGLPHMGRQRSRRDVLEFLQAGHDFLRHAASQGQRGIIIFGDGDAWEKARNANSYTSCLDGNMMHYQALLESIQVNFPAYLGEARTCMECLFVAPFVSCSSWSEAWEEAKYGNFHDLRFGLQGWKFSQEYLMEAKEMVKEGQSQYGVRIEGESCNEMVLDWRGVPLVRVSCWRS